MRTVIGLQQRLDSGGLKLGPGDTRPDYPLFVQSGEIEGHDYGSRLDASSSCGIAIITGPRGLVPDAHYEGDVFSTLGTTALQMHRDAWGLGPPGGWTACRQLKINGTFEAVGFSDWHGVGVLGTQGNKSSPDPEPYQVYCANGKVWLALKTDLGGVQLFGADHSGDVLSFTFEVDLDLGTVTCSLGTITNGNGTLPPGAKLQSRCIHPYTVGRLCPTKAGEGPWCGAWSNLKIAALNVWYNGVQVCTLYPENPRPQTYPGGPSLPLVAQQPGMWAHVVHESEDSTDYFGGQLSVKNLWIKGHPGCPAILLGGLFGARFRSVQIDDGQCGLATNLAGVGYPIHGDDLTFHDQKDCNVFAWKWTMTSSLSRCDMGKAKRCAIHLVGSSVAVMDVTLAPPSPTPALASVVQVGGSCEYRNVKDNYEYPNPDGHFLRLEGDAFDEDANGPFPTSAVLDGCSFRVPPAGTMPFAPDPRLVHRSTRPGYTGGQKIVVDGQIVY